MKMHIMTSQSVKNLMDKWKKCLFYSEILVYRPLAIKSILFNTAICLDKKYSFIFASDNVINIYCKGLDFLN